MQQEQQVLTELSPKSITSGQNVGKNPISSVTSFPITTHVEHSFLAR